MYLQWMGVYSYTQKRDLSHCKIITVKMIFVGFHKLRADWGEIFSVVIINVTITAD